LFFDRNIHGILPCLFAGTNVLFGVVGFYLSWWCAQKNRLFLAHSLWTTSYVIMFGILGFGYARFLYPGTIEQWKSGIQYPLTSFFTSEVFYTLLAMSLPVVFPIYYILITWPQYTSSQIQQSRWAILISNTLSITVGVVGFLLYLKVVSKSEVQRLVDGPLFGYYTEYAPLVGYAVAQLGYVLLTGWPLVVVALRSRRKEKVY